MAHDSVDVGYNLPGKQFAINTLNTGGIGGWPRALGQNLNGAQCNNCALVRNVIDTCLRKILVERSVAGAVDYAKQTISDLLQNKLDISLLVITKVCWRGEGQRERVQRLPRPLHFVCLDLLTPKSWCPGNSLRGRLFHACCCPQPCLCVRAPGAGQGRRL